VRNRIVGLSLVLGAALSFPSVLHAQAAEQPGTAKAKSTTPTDLSGIWAQHPPASALEYYRYAFSEEEPPMTAWAKEKYKVVESFRTNPNTELSDPVYSCFPPGVPRIFLQPFPMEIIQIPGRVIMIFEYDHFVRQIYMDRREHPKDLNPTWMGDSIGWWDGNTLVVDTIGFNDKTWIDKRGHPHSEALHVVERLRRVNHNTLVIDITIDDPKAYTKAWVGRATFQLKPGWNIMEMICEDNVNFLDFHKTATTEPSK
jgi:hypothetical protein